LDKEKKTNNRLAIILASVVGILLIATIVVLVIVLTKTRYQNVTDTSNGNGQTQSNVIGYEANVVTTDEETLQKLVDEMVSKAAEGTMALEMKTEAVSSDGTNFDCYIANSVSNNYDMFVVIYLDETQEELYRSGLIPLGSRIEKFTSSVKLSPGTYVGTIVYNQVEDDQATIHSQVNIGLQLIVQ